MGQLILVEDWKGAHLRGPQFVYDPGCPLSYLAAERVEHGLGQVLWLPAISADLQGLHSCDSDAVQADAAVTARALHLPLVWPERYPEPVRRAARAAAHANAAGFGARFGLAALRLAFCGGFDLDEPEVLAEAAAAAGIGVTDCLEAAEDPNLDGPDWQTGAKLGPEGGSRLPAIRMGHSTF